MTGRQWRYAAVMMPHIIAGIGGPAEVACPHPNAAPTAVPIAAHVHGRAARIADDMLDDGHGPDGAVLEAGEEVLPDPTVPDMATSAEYQRVFGTSPLHEAVLDVYCRMAVLSGKLMGDNVCDATVMTEAQMRDLDDEARSFIVDYLDVLFGPVNTTKAHRLASHMLSYLLQQGNLWVGDTSENEALHRVCKRMFVRSNKRGPTMILQMMRAAESQTEVLREMHDTEDAAEASIDSFLGQASGSLRTTEVDLELHRVLPRSRRGNRFTVADLSALPGMGSLVAALGVPQSTSVVVAPSISFFCVFEWGAPAVVQTAHATESYEGRPRYDFLRFLDAGGLKRVGWVRLVVRMVDGEGDDFAVVRLLEPAPPRPHCSLTRFGCERLAWSFPDACADWPTLVKVPLSCFLRLEHVVPDFRDLGDRRGLRARPSTVPDDAAERHASHFFTNAFMPWTSRAQHPGQ